MCHNVPIKVKAAPKTNTKIEEVAVTCDNPLTHICEVTKQVLQYKTESGLVDTCRELTLRKVLDPRHHIL